MGRWRQYVTIGGGGGRRSVSMRGAQSVMGPLLSDIGKGNGLVSRNNTRPFIRLYGLQQYSFSHLL